MTLLLLPNLLGEGLSHELYMPVSVDRAVASIKGLIVEDEKEGRRYLKMFGQDFRGTPMQVLSEHTQDKDLDTLLEPLLKGERWGLISDCGLPCLADPGSKLVYRAREKGIAVEAFTGPSSLVFSLMLSGLPAQRFAFHGYLDREYASLKILEKRSLQDKATQVFIETPYRSQKCLEALLKNLLDTTYLCVAADISLPTQIVETHPVRVWKQKPLLQLDKKPTIFLISCSL